jgi:hypothetical protein
MKVFVVTRVRKLEARLLPRGLFDVVRQIALFGGLYWGYRLVRGAVDGKAATAFANARDLISIERATHTFVEPSLQAWAIGKSGIMVVANWLYLNSQFSIALGILLFIYFFHNGAFYFLRNMMLVSMALALVGYLLLPTAPPRFLPEWGFTDTVSAATGVAQDSTAVNAFFNPFAAVPSMHCAFALMLGWTLARLVKYRAAKWFWTFYPFCVMFAVVVTANHYWLDALLGALVAGLSWVAAYELGRARPAAWSFRTGGLAAEPLSPEPLGAKAPA